MTDKKPRAVVRSAGVSRELQRVRRERETLVTALAYVSAGTWASIFYEAPTGTVRAAKEIVDRERERILRRSCHD